MPRIRLRVCHASTGAEETFGNDTFVEGEVERLSSIAERLQTVGELTVSIETASLLGVARKRLPPGRHRAVVEAERDGVWDTDRPLISGTLTNERAAHGRAWDGGIRRWSLAIVDDAVDAVWARLEGVQLRAAAEALTAGRYDMEWCEASGAGVAVVPRTAWGVDALTGRAFAAAALPAPADVPTALSAVLPGVVPSVALCAPRPEAGTAVGVRNIPAWTGAQLVELRCEVEQLVLEASYAAWPSADIGAVVLRSTSAPLPASGTPEFAALVNLDDAGAGVPWHDEYDWSTEPGEADGAVLDDFALSYAKGPDGSYIGTTGVLELPLQATYAARTVALSGTRAPGRDGGREIENKQHLELPVLLAPAQAATAIGTAFETVQIASYAVDVSRPCFDIGNDEPDEEAVYLVSLVDRSGQWRAVAERRGATGRAVCETWAREIYPALSYAVGDAEVVTLTVPLDAVPEDDVRLGDALAGVRFEELAWVVRSLSRREDAQEVELAIARPAGAESAAEGGGGSSGGGRVETPPTLVAVASQSLESDQSGSEQYFSDRVEVDAAAETAADTPAEISVEVEASPGVWQPVAPQTVRQRSVTCLIVSNGPLVPPGTPAPTNPYEGQSWRARCRYPSGTVTAWTTTTAT